MHRHSIPENPFAPLWEKVGSVSGWDEGIQGRVHPSSLP